MPTSLPLPRYTHTTYHTSCRGADFFFFYCSVTAGFREQETNCSSLNMSPIQRERTERHRRTFFISHTVFKFRQQNHLVRFRRKTSWFGLRSVCVHRITYVTYVMYWKPEEAPFVTMATVRDQVNRWRLYLKLHKVSKTVNKSADSVWACLSGTTRLSSGLHFQATKALNTERPLGSSSKNLAVPHAMNKTICDCFFSVLASSPWN